MKKFIFPIIVFCSILIQINIASAIDFKAKGQFIMSFDLGAGSEGASAIGGNNVYGWGSNSIIFRGPDNFNANQRIRLQLDAIASESLSGTMAIEIGENKWGSARQGAALGADGTIVEVKHAYIDWIIPNTQLKTRIGIQPYGLPSKSTIGSMILSDDAAGITLSNRFNDNLAATTFWARLYNDNYQNDNTNNALFKTASSNYLDNADLFGLSLPLDFNNFSLTPWAAYMMIGQNFMRNNWNNTPASLGNAINTVSYGLLPMPFATSRNALTSPLNSLSSNLHTYGNTWFAGLAGKINITTPLHLAWDFNYGSADFGHVNNINLNKRGGNAKTKDMALKRAGFYASILLEYKMDWATPSFFAWYSSGDDENPWNGSERMPSLNNLSSGVTFSNFAGNGDPTISRKAVIGQNLIGLWGMGLQLKNIQHTEKLKHSVRLNYIGGTNHTEMARYIDADAGYFQGTSGNGFYLTTADNAVELGLTTEYQIYDNLKLYFDAEYLALNISQSNKVWGNNFTPTNAWNINFSAIYSF